MSRAVGIDLGTTNSVLAYITGKNTPEVADNLDSEKWTPSLVFYDDSGEFIVGKSVRDMGQKDPERMVYSIKRFMGRDYDDPVLKNQIESQRFPYIIEKDEKGEVLVRLGDRYFSPPEISAFILEGIKRYGEAYIEDEISHAVITVPAYFGTRQKEVTRQAGRLAGFNVLRVLPEPTAAALAYGLDADPEEPKTVLVYDLGGGTLDVTVMFIGGGTFMDQGKSGDMWLGGDDFDNCIVDDLVQMIQDQYRVDVRTLPNSKEIMLTLKYKAERAKIQLSNTTRTQIIIPGLIRSGGKIVTVEYEIDRSRFNDMIQPLVKRSIDIVYEGIKKANTTIEDIDTILMVGGSTRVPMVEDELHRIFPGKVARKKINPMLCVAQGAAIQTLMIDPAEFDSQPDPQIVECKECGTLNIKDRADCRKCGEIIGEGKPIRVLITPPRPTIECPECGVANTLGSTECKNCGYFFEKPGEGVMEKLSRPIGIELEGGALEIILSDDMFLPTDPVTTLLHTTKADQRRVVMPVYEGDKPVAKENQYLGIVEGPLPPGLPIRTDVNVTLRADIDGTLQVTAEVPSCPEVKIEAIINWKVKPVNGGLIEDTPTPKEPQTWENEAMVVLFMAAAVREEGKNLLPPHIYDPIMQLAEQLEQARRIGDERNGRRIMDQLRPLVENLIFVTVGLAKIIKQDPELPRKIGMQKAERLAQILNKLDQLRQAGRTDEYVQVYKAELEGFINEIIGLLTAKEGGNLGDLLQKASSSSSDWKS